MRNRKPRVPVYQHHKARGLARVKVNGHDIYLGPYNSPESHQEYNRIIAELTSQAAAPPARKAARSSNISVAKLALAYIQWAEQNYAREGVPNREYAHIRTALRPLKDLYGLTRVADFGPIALKTVREQWIDAGHARSYINDHTARLKRMFKWGVENELVPPTIHQALQCVSGLRRGRGGRETKKIRPVAQAHIGAVLKVASSPVAAMIQLQALTGMRPGEVVLMRGSDLTMHGDTWEYIPERHKCEHLDIERIIFLGPRAQAIVREFLKPDLTAYLFDPAEGVREKHAQQRAARKTPLRGSHRRAAARKRKPHPKWQPAEHYTTASYRRAIQRACVKAGVPSWHPNQLRHNRATELRRQYGIEVARVVLGHRSAATTEIYTEADRQRAASVMGEVG